MSFTPQFLDELRQRLSLVSVISRKVRLVRRGRESTGLCPFHNEKSPSFTVSDEKGFFHCFGCGAHGDVIGFLMRSEGLELSRNPWSAWRGRRGWRCPSPRPRSASAPSARRPWSRPWRPRRPGIEEQLAGSAGRGALDYLKRRGLAEANHRAVPPGLCAGGPHGAARCADPGRGLHRAGARGGAGRQGRGRRALRPHARPGHLSHRRPARPGDRLRRADPGRGPAQISELAGDAALPQGPHPLWPGPGAPPGARTPARSSWPRAIWM